MKPFRFSLKALQTLRERQEYEALERYARAIQGREAALLALHTLEEAIADLRHLWQETVIAGALASRVAQTMDYGQVLEARRQERRTDVAVCQQRVDQTWNHLLSLRQQREVLDQCCNRQRQCHEQAMQREIQKQIDEMALRIVAEMIPESPVSNPTWN